MPNLGPPVYLAVDFDQVQGRAAAGWIDPDGMLQVEAVHRFQTVLTEGGGYTRWDAFALWSEILQALSLARKRFGGRLASVGLTAPASDFGLLTDEDILLGNPVFGAGFPDSSMVVSIYRIVPQDRVFQQTGCLLKPASTLAQLYGMVERTAPELSLAHRLLPLPSLFNLWLSGRKAVDASTAAGMGCANPLTGGWAVDLIRELGLPTRLFGEIVSPDTMLGSLREDVRQETGCGPVSVIAGAGDRTASAADFVVDTSASSFSIVLESHIVMVLEQAAPLLSLQAAAAGWCSQPGSDGRIRLVKHLPGLALLQRLGDVDDLASEAQAASAFGPLVPPDFEALSDPGDLMENIREICEDSGQRSPQTRGEAVRCLMESLALEIRRVEEQLGDTLRTSPEILLVGEGVRNSLLAGMIAGASGRTVEAVPVDAALNGSLLAQAETLGTVASSEARRAVSNQALPSRYELPEDQEQWDEAYQRYLAVRARLADS